MSALNDKCRLCRREGEKLYLKGERCFTAKCAIVKRKYPPGVHGQTRRTKLTDYGKQLREKQTAKITYGLRERQFVNYIKKALRKKGNTVDFMACFLESRLDNVIYRLGYSPSRRSARQLVGHGFFYVNNKKVDIPSFLVKPKDLITVNPFKANKKIVSELKERLKNREIPGWLYLNKEQLEAKVIEPPKFEHAEKTFDAQAVIEFYSR